MKYDDEINPFSTGFNVGKNTIWHLFNQKNHNDNCEKCKDRCRKLFCPRIMDQKKPKK